MATTDNQKKTKSNPTAQQTEQPEMTSSAEDKARQERDSNPFTGQNTQNTDHPFAQNGAQTGNATNGGQQQQVAPSLTFGQQMRALALRLLAQAAVYLWGVTKRNVSQLFKSGASTILPVVQDAFYTMVGQPGTVVLVRDRETNKVIDRIIFDRKGLDEKGAPLDEKKIMERYQQNGYAKDVVIDIYAVDNINLHREEDAVELTDKQLSKRINLIEVLWREKNNGADPAKMRTAYRAYQRSQEVAYLRNKLKECLKHEQFKEAIQILRDTQERDRVSGKRQLNELLVCIDEDMGDKLSAMKDDLLLELQGLLKESCDRLYWMNIEDYVDKDLSTLPTEERAYVRTLVLCGIGSLDETERTQAESVRDALSRFDLEQKWNIQGSKFWELEDAEMWSLCKWADSCNHVTILNEQATLLLQGVADASEVSHLLSCFEKGTSPIAEYLAGVYACQTASGYNYAEKRAEMWERYCHPDVQALELSKLKKMLADKSYKNAQGEYQQDKLRAIATVMVNLSIASTDSTDKALDELFKNNKVLKELMQTEEFRTEMRRAQNIVGNPTEDISKKVSQQGPAEDTEEVLVPEVLASKPMRSKEEVGGITMSSGVDEQMVPEGFITPEPSYTEDMNYDDMVEQARQEQGLGSTYPSAPEPVLDDVTERKPSSKVRLSSFYAQFKDSAPDRPELRQQLGIDNLQCDDQAFLDSAVERVWCEAMALCMNLTTPQQIRNEGISGSLIRSSGHSSVDSTLDRLLNLYVPILEDLSQACHMESVEQLINQVKEQQLAREITVIKPEPRPEVSQEVLDARQLADSLIAAQKPDVPDDFYAVMFDLPFPVQGCERTASTAQLMERANRIVALADAFREGRVGEESLLALVRDEQGGIVGITKDATARDIVSAIEGLKVEYGPKRNQFFEDYNAKKEAQIQGTKGHKR